jgi:hypothetical protein
MPLKYNLQGKFSTIICIAEIIGERFLCSLKSIIGIGALAPNKIKWVGGWDFPD